jgi:hypothetical protein
MAGSRAEKAVRRRLLAGLARELSMVLRLPARRRCTAHLVPYLSLRRATGGRVRVYCVSDAGLYAFLTGDGTVISLDGGIAAAAQSVAAACRPPGPGLPAGGHPAQRMKGGSGVSSPS